MQQQAYATGIQGLAPQAIKQAYSCDQTQVSDARLAQLRRQCDLAIMRSYREAAACLGALKDLGPLFK